jgi:filamentous hemagglutinin family protein
MNRSYQLVWNSALRVVQVASEMARRPGTRGVSAIGSPPRLQLTAVALALATALGLPSPVRADVELPVFGSATGATPTVSIVGNTLTFTQPASSSIRVDWTSFNVGAGGTVSLLQTVAPGTTASHSVSSGTASLIDGSLTMQGRQAFANARGITIGATSVVGGDDLVLAAMSMSPSANGNPAGYLFDAGGTAASLVNAGTTQGAAYGSMALLGSSVRNEGAITASYNDIQIVAASHVDDGGPTSNYPSNPPVLGGYAPLLNANGGQPAIDNAGTITNPGGSVRLLATASPGLYDTLIRNSGTISTGGGPGDATGTVRLDASGGDIVTSGAIHGGRLVALYADAKVLVSGTIDTSGDDYFGGRVEIGGSLNDPAGMVPKVAYVGDGARIAVGEHVGGIAIKAIDALHLGGVVNAHGVSGSVNLSSSGYLEADAQVDLGYFQGSPGDFTIHSGDAMVVTDAVVSRIDANGVYTPGGPSQVRASMLGAAGGNTWLNSDSDIGIDADLTFAANNGIRMYAEATGSVALAQGKSIAFTGRQNGTLALIAAQGITLGAQSSISFNPLAYNMLILQGRTIHTDAAVDASYVTATASQGDITQDYGPIHADKMDADATGDIALLADNRMTTLGMSAGGDATIRNRDSLRIDRADIAGATSLWSMGDIDATAPNNRFVGQVSLQAFDVALSDSVALGVGTVRAHDLSLTSPAGITFYGDTMASYRGWFTTVNQPITQQAGTSLYVNGDATFNAGTADITLDSPRNVFNSRINAIGGNIRLADANGMMIWNVSASGQLWLAPGGPAPSASFYGTVAAHDTHVEGSAYIGYSGAEHALTGDLSTTGFVALSGSVRHTYDGDFSVGTDLYQEGSISALNGHTIVHGLTSTFGGTLLVGDRDHDTAVLTSDVLVGSFLGGTGRIDGDVTATVSAR